MTTLARIGLLLGTLGLAASAGSKPISLVLKRVQQAGFSMLLPADFKDDGNGKHGWMWGAVLKDPTRWPAEELQSNYDHCPVMGMQKILYKRKVKTAVVEGTQIFCEGRLPGRFFALGLRLNSRRDDIHYAGVLYVDGPKDGKGLRKMLDRVADSIEEGPDGG